MRRGERRLVSGEVTMEPVINPYEYDPETCRTQTARITRDVNIIRIYYKCRY